MTDKTYVIIGAEVDQAEYFLHDDGTIDSDKGADGQPLNVEFIGKLMVDLSRRGKSGVPRAELAQAENQIKHALAVADFSAVNGGAVLTDAQRQEILDRTDVQVEFETRRRFAKKPDRNLRVLVVPSDKTLEITDAALKAQGPAQGFRPPLSYEMDRALMLASLKPDIMQMVKEFAPTGEPGWTAQLRDKLAKHMEAAIEDRCVFKDAGGHPADDVKNEIMQSPLRSFYRSVGIYATNMCR